MIFTSRRKHRTIPHWIIDQTLYEDYRQAISYQNNCRDFSVEGVILRDSAAFTVIPANCDGFVMDNIKTIGMWRFNSDGIDLFNSRNAVIRNCFLRNFDDCIVIKGVRGFSRYVNVNPFTENITFMDQTAESGK